MKVIALNLPFFVILGHFESLSPPHEAQTRTAPVPNIVILQRL